MEIAKYKKEIGALKEKLESKQEKLDQQKARILQEANEEAHAILREAKEYADQTMKNFHKFGKNNISVKEWRQNASVFAENDLFLSRRRKLPVP